VVIDAVRASIALPGLFTPARHDGRLLVDGGLVNPVPVSLCRAMGADIVIAVDLNWELVTRRRPPVARMAAAALSGPPPVQQAEHVKQATALTHSGRLEALLARFWPFGDTRRLPDTVPSVLGVMSASLNIMQVRITQSRLAGEPADAMVRPRLTEIGAMDFHRGSIAIDEGERAAELAIPLIQGLLA